MLDVLREQQRFVERIVRPLTVPFVRQRRLRTELLEHLQAIYAEELARTPNAEAALQSSFVRFGDPGELTAELRGTVCPWETWEYRLEQCFEQRPGESPFGYALRMSGSFAMGLALLASLTAAVTVAGGSSLPLALRFALAAMSFPAIWFCSFLTCCVLFGAEWHAHRRSWLRIGPLVAGMAASWPAGYALALSIASGGWPSDTDWLPAALFGGLFSVLSGPALGVLREREAAARREWAALMA